jgi:ABC-type uncharacterized transport system involved in gliding motility auxiliary subunit
MNNMDGNGKTMASRSIWRQRGKRFATGLNVCVSIAMAAVLTGMVNYLSMRYYAHWDFSWRRHYELSDKTKGLIASLNNKVEILVFFRTNHERYQDIRNLLREYEYAAARSKPQRLSISFVDPDRDLARTRDLKQKYDLTDANVVVFSSGGRRKYVESPDIMEDEVRFENGKPVRKHLAFRGEQAFSSAIQSVVQASRPVVYFLAGHAERDINDYGEESGFSAAAKVMRRDNIEVKQLQLAECREIPEDCSTLVLAGPEKRLSGTEVDMLAGYLNKGGRLLLMIDPSVTIGLERALEDWGVKLGQGVVVGRTLTGDDLVVTEYGQHPITRNLSRISTEFFMPRPIEPVQTQDNWGPEQPDKPRISVLASNTKEGWLENDLKQRPPRYDAGIDRHGPIPVAVAIEKGLLNSIDLQIKPTRIVVIGDSYFVSNGGLKRAIGGNMDFFMSAVNWLVAREELLAIGPKRPGELRLDMNRRQMRTAYMIIIGAMPLMAACIGLAVRQRRRQ